MDLLFMFIRKTRDIKKEEEKTKKVTERELATGKN